MNGTRAILVVDDEQGIRESLKRMLERESYQVHVAEDGRAGLDLLRREQVNVLLTDLRMPVMDGMDLLKAARTVAPDTEVIVMTAYGTVDVAVDAMRQGAYDFITKPLKKAHILKTVEKALERQALRMENQALRAELSAARNQDVIIGSSIALRRTLEIIAQAAPSAATVLILGESGTGKELLARAIHQGSPRAGGPFVAVNCSALPESIIEAELFGYEKGSFTGAVSSREGRFMAADGGTLFLDEIGELPPHIQVKLLRVLQEGEVERLGGRSVKVDIRVVAATNRQIQEEVRSGRFREDLYYRLNVIAVKIPPLRERLDDVPLLAEHFLRKYSEKNSKTLAGFSRAALDLLCGYHWPGNVRELENAVERAVVLTRGEVIDVADLPPDIHGRPGVNGRSITIPIGTALEEIERRVIQETLRHTDGDKRLAAQLLGIATRTIYRKLEADRGGEDG
ncbi:MAG: sigma-54 dependent transcriptional regulator [Polyangia bacterium]|jgi:two-component system response regulator HydG|nr:sigma-54 dependent transcriptional regulator [Polyangia bacterium]